MAQRESSTALRRRLRETEAENRDLRAALYHARASERAAEARAGAQARIAADLEAALAQAQDRINELERGATP